MKPKALRHAIDALDEAKETARKVAAYDVLINALVTITNSTHENEDWLRALACEALEKVTTT